MSADTVAPSSYLAVHASSSLEETLNLAGVLLSPNGLRQLGRRPSAGSRPELLDWLRECRRTCLAAGIALDDICVVGSSPLEVVGVRPSTDVDFTLKSRYRTERYGMGVSHLTPVVDIVTAGYHRSREGAAIADDELIDNPDFHFMFRGLKFANPEIVLDQKDFYRRDKDVKDLEAASAAFAAPRAESFDPAFEFASSTEVLIRELTGQGPAKATRVPEGHSGGLSRRLYGVWTRLAARARRLSALARSPHAR
jgi:hypothetical protein